MVRRREVKEAAAIDKEAREERAERDGARRRPFLPGLRLPDLDGVFILDTFQWRA